MAPPVYSAVHEKRFQKLLDSGDINGARKVLESLPPSQSGQDAVLRAGFMIRGYQSILERMGDSKYGVLSEFGSPEDIKANLHRFELYKQIGDIPFIRGRLESLQGYEGFGSPEIIKRKLDELDQYREQGTLEELEKRLSDLEKRAMDGESAMKILG